MQLADWARASRACQHDPFVKAAQMRGNEGVRPVACRFQHPLQESNRRALPIRTGHMNNGRNPPVRVAKRAKQALDPSEREVDALRVKFFKPCKKALGFLRMQRRIPELEARLELLNGQ